MKKLWQILNLIRCLPYHHSTSPSSSPLPLAHIFPFVAGPKGPSFVNAQRCDPLSTKHLKTEWGWKNMRNMRRDKRVRGWWRTLKRVELDMEHVDRLEIGRISHIFTPQCPAATGSAKISNLDTNWQHLWRTCDAISRVGPHRGKTGRQETSCVNGRRSWAQNCFSFTQLDCNISAAVSRTTSLAVDPLWWCGELRHPSSHFCFCGKLSFPCRA